VETCKDCVYFRCLGAVGWNPNLTPHPKKGYNEFTCNYRSSSGLTKDNWKIPCGHFRRKQMSDKIEIDVRVNGEPAKLSDISDETIANLKKSEKVKQVKHGDYGFLTSEKQAPRFFFEVNGAVGSYDKYGEMVAPDANKVDRLVYNPCYKYLVTGNVFEDMRNGKFKDM